MSHSKNNGVVCYTSFTYTYLSRACVLATTLRQAHPDWAIWAVVVDLPPPGIDLRCHLALFDRVVPADTLGIPSFLPWLFKHNIVEACTAVKGRMMMRLFEEGFDKVVYLDPDIAVFHPLSVIERKLDNFSILLTPHQVAPNDTRQAIEDNEMASMKHGAYNLGFIATRNDTTGRTFAAWWDKMLYEACYEDLEAGVFTDQKYCDIVPSLFDGVHIERDPGCNVASWNISRRMIRIGADGDIAVNGSPLKFYHFTKVNSVGDLMTERYARKNDEVLEIWHWYKRQLAQTDLDQIPPDYWAYGHFDSGERIPDALRVAFRSNREPSIQIGNPFLADAETLAASFICRDPHKNIPESQTDSAPERPVTAITAEPLSVGWDYFDEAWYLAANPDVVDAIQRGFFRSAIEHFVQFGCREGRMPRGIIVDEHYYLETYDDVRQAIEAGVVRSAQQHFEVRGYWEGRKPAPSPE